VYGQATFSNSIIASSNLTTLGATLLSNNVAVYGQATFSNALFTSGAVTLNGLGGPFVANGGFGSMSMAVAGPYPPISIISATASNLSGLLWGNGTYLTTAGYGISYKGFQVTPSQTIFYTGSNGLYASGSNGSCLGTVANTVDLTATTYYGDYLDLTLPSAMTLTAYSLVGFGNNSNNTVNSQGAPYKWWVFGTSNTGTTNTWQLLSAVTGNSNSASMTQVANAPNAFNRYRVVVNLVNGAGANSPVYVNQWLLYGGSNVAVAISGNASVSSNLTVASNIVASNALSVYGQSTFSNVLTAASNVIILGASNMLGVGTATPSYPIHVASSSNSVSIYAAGDVTIFSDRRQKEDLIPIERALEKVRGIRGYTYRMIKKPANSSSTELNGKRSAGVIAQEVREVFPEVVHEDASTGLLSVAYPNMVALLVEAVSELEREVARNRLEILRMQRKMRLCSAGASRIVRDDGGRRREVVFRKRNHSFPNGRAGNRTVRSSTHF
jgi:hypothetical protein